MSASHEHTWTLTLKAGWRKEYLCLCGATKSEEDGVLVEMREPKRKADFDTARIVVKAEDQVHDVVLVEQDLSAWRFNEKVKACELE